MTALQKVNLGTAPTGTDGDTVRTANVKVNANVDVLNTQATLMSSSPNTVRDLTAADMGKRVNFTPTAASSVRFPAANTTGADQLVAVHNLSAAYDITMAVATGSGDTPPTIVVVKPGEMLTWETDGVSVWRTIGRKKAFDEVVQGKLTVGGVVQSTSGGFKFPDGSSQVSAAFGMPNGRCRLVVASATSLQLVPFDGNTLVIGGVPQAVPAAGVSLAVTGLAASTFYYVYAYMNGTTMTLEASTTARATGTDGTQIKSGDSSRALVGMVCPNGSTQFVDGPTARLCFSWFNRRAKSILTASGTNSTASATLIQIGGPVSFIVADGECARLSASGYTGNSTAGVYNNTTLYVDGGAQGAASIGNIAAGYQNIPIANQVDVGGLADGVHNLTLWGATSGGNASFNFAFGGLIRG